jgi:hypothetical protein
VTLGSTRKGCGNKIEKGKGGNQLRKDLSVSSNHCEQPGLDPTRECAMQTPKLSHLRRGREVFICPLPTIISQDSPGGVDFLEVRAATWVGLSSEDLSRTNTGVEDVLWTHTGVGICWLRTTTEGLRGQIPIPFLEEGAEQTQCA